jgi:hypothetical protein
MSHILCPTDRENLTGWGNVLQPGPPYWSLAGELPLAKPEHDSVSMVTRALGMTVLKSCWLNCLEMTVGAWLSFLEQWNQT